MIITYYLKYMLCVYKFYYKFILDHNENMSRTTIRWSKYRSITCQNSELDFNCFLFLFLDYKMQLVGHGFKLPKKISLLAGIRLHTLTLRRPRSGGSLLHRLPLLFYYNKDLKLRWSKCSLGEFDGWNSKCL